MADEDAVTEFLRESNAIEDVFDERSLDDAKKAWKHLLKAKTLTENAILETHSILMHNHLGVDEAGKWRQCSVYVGGRPGLYWQKIPAAIMHWIERANKKFDAKACHIEFEHIHPFIDGNGRIGRMLYNWMLLDQGKPIRVIKASEREDYYSWF